MTTLNHLPLEIIERSLKYCKKATLKSCCLVNAFMLPIARPLLFRSLVIQRSLLKAILRDEFPYLSMSRILYIYLWDCRDQEFISLVEKLAACVDHHRLQLHIEAEAGYPDDKEIKAISNALLTVPRSSTFIIIHTTFYLTEAYIVPPWPECATALIKGASIFPQDGKQFGKYGEHYSRPVLETLHLQAIPSVEQIQHQLDLRELKRLGLNIEPSANEVLHFVSNTIEVLSISPPSSDAVLPNSHPELFTPATLEFPRLKSLVFWVFSMSKKESWLVPTLSTISNKAPQLESISICFCIGTEAEGMQDPNEHLLQLIDPQRHLVSILRSIRRLTRVEVALESWEIGKEKEDAFSKTIKDGLQEYPQYLTVSWISDWHHLWPFFGQEID
ncbi:hypothetical protein DL96DRAFT_1817321 [Flagelloscypha sp. PMI_526]|nr:hypothetical protein DL96DRAFT_1817321 [Flagelloscypha sp. PMI_526]